MRKKSRNVGSLMSAGEPGKRLKKRGSLIAKEETPMENREANPKLSVESKNGLQQQTVKKKLESARSKRLEPGARGEKASKLCFDKRVGCLLRRKH